MLYLKRRKTARYNILITGASTGIGLATAKMLIGSGHHLILTAREESLHRFATHGIQESENIWLRKLCVQKTSDRRSVVDEINQQLGGVDVLINNAGIAYRSVLEHVQENERLHQMHVNFIGPMGLMRLVLPSMRQKRSGKIINISSVGGMMAMPTMAIYSASKFALEGASESLYYEVKPWGISVTLLEPGFIRSDGFSKVPYTEESCLDADNPIAPYHNHYKYMSEFIARMMQSSPATPESVAKKIVHIINHPNPPLRMTATPDAFIFELFRRYAPRRFYHWLLFRSLPKIKSWGK
jgi:short-subunit dehydrogenase